jgi:hypothetical protein
VNPGATAAQTRWRVGAWCVGAGILVPLIDAGLFGPSDGLILLGLVFVVLGGLVANPLRTIGRLRTHGKIDPVVRLKPLGLFSYVAFFITFVLPFAVGEWLLRLIGERWGDRRRPPPDDEDTLDGDPLVWPAVGRRNRK